MAAVPTVADVRAWTGATEDDVDDTQLQLVLDSEADVQSRYITWDPTLYPEDEIPEPVALALLRRCARTLAARGVPLSSLPFANSGEGAPYGLVRPLTLAIPRYDNEIERYEAPFRVAGIA